MMKLNKLLMVSLLILAIFAIGAVSAADDNATSDDLAAVEDSDIESSIDNDILANGSVGTFSQLNESVTNTPVGGTLELDMDYVNNDSFSRSGIEIRKAITIDGKGHTLDAKSASRMFVVYSSGVVLKNIVFSKGSTTFFDNCYAGAIYCSSWADVINCTFTDCFSRDYAGAMYGGNAYNCTFTNCRVNADGGALYYTSAYNCSFYNCRAESDAGAIYKGSAYDCNFQSCRAGHDGGATYYTNVYNSTFSNCRASRGGAMYNGTATNCNFTKNIAENWGGAINNAKATGCNFIRNSAPTGGAVSQGSAENCNFTNNTADKGGAIDAGYATNCRFAFNSVLGSGGAIDEGYAYNCIFINNTATENGGGMYGFEAVNCTFENCSAKGKGGGVCGCVIENCTFINCSPQDIAEPLPIIKIDANDIIYGETAIVNITINEDATGNITVLLDGNKIDANFSQGHASIALANLAKKQHTIKVIFSGDEKYNKTSKEAKFYVKTLPELKLSYSAPDNSHASLTIRFTPTLTGEVKVIAANKTRTVSISSGKGSVALSNLTVGEIITVIYAGNFNYAACNKTITFKGNSSSSGGQNTTPVTYPAKVSASDLTMVYTDGSQFKVTVYGTDGKLASYVSVVIRVNSKQVATVKTDSNGVATYTPTQTPGTYKITAVFGEAQTTNTLTVKHIVTLKTVKVKKSANKLVIQASLAKVNGKYLKNKKVTFKFNGKTYKAKTNAKGVAKVTIKKSALKKLKVGKKVTYQATYSKDTVKKTAKVSK